MSTLPKSQQQRSAVNRSAAGAEYTQSPRSPAHLSLSFLVGCCHLRGILLPESLFPVPSPPLPLSGTAPRTTSSTIHNLPSSTAQWPWPCSNMLNPALGPRTASSSSSLAAASPCTHSLHTSTSSCLHHKWRHATQQEEAAPSPAPAGSQLHSSKLEENQKEAQTFGGLAASTDMHQALKRSARWSHSKCISFCTPHSDPSPIHITTQPPPALLIERRGREGGGGRERGRREGGSKVEAGPVLGKIKRRHTGFEGRWRERQTVWVQNNH